MLQIPLLTLFLSLLVTLAALYGVARFRPNTPKGIVKWGVFMLLYLPIGLALSSFIGLFGPSLSMMAMLWIVGLSLVAPWLILALWDRLIALWLPHYQSALFPWRQVRGNLLYFSFIIAGCSLVLWLDSLIHNPALTFLIAVGLGIFLLALFILNETRSSLQQ